MKKGESKRPPAFDRLPARVISALVLPLLTATALTQGFSFYFLKKSDGVYMSFVFWGIAWAAVFYHCFFTTGLKKLWLSQLSIVAVFSFPFLRLLFS